MKTELAMKTEKSAIAVTEAPVSVKSAVIWFYMGEYFVNLLFATAE